MNLLLNDLTLNKYIEEDEEEVKEEEDKAENDKLDYKINICTLG